jgi:transposase InsO family protein
MRYRESLLKYANKHGVAKASRKYNEYASFIYFWRSRWEASGRDIESLRNISKHPYHHPNEHTEAELTLIKNLRRRNPNIGLMDLWHKLRSRGYTRSISGLHKALVRLGMPTSVKSNPSPTYKSKPYEQMTHPGERVQIDVKYVPIDCIDHHIFGKNPYFKLFQYTAIDEYSRLRILGGYDEHNTHSSSLFLKSAVSFYKAHGIEVECVQTDNGTEFTKRLLAKDNNNLSSFELTAKHLNIRVKHIKPHTPRHNGKVERSHREDQKLFYSRVTGSNRMFKGLDDFRKKLKRHQDITNNRPMRPLNYLSPLDYLKKDT